MQVASLTGDIRGHSAWLKNKQNFPQLEWNGTAEKSQRGPKQTTVSG